MRKGNFKYEIKQRIAVLGECENGTKELNLIAFNGNPPKYDLRTWRRDENGEQMLKGVTLSEDEMRVLQKALAELEL